MGEGVREGFRDRHAHGYIYWPIERQTDRLDPFTIYSSRLLFIDRHLHHILTIDNTILFICS